MTNLKFRIPYYYSGRLDRVVCWLSSLEEDRHRRWRKTDEQRNCNTHPKKKHTVTRKIVTILPK